MKVIRLLRSWQHFPHQSLHHLRQGANGHGSLRLAQDIKESVIWQQGRYDSNFSDSQCLGMHVDFGDFVRICADDNEIMCFLARREVLRQQLQPTTCNQAPRCLNCWDGLHDCIDTILQAEICFCAYAPLATMEKAKEYRHRLPDGQEKSACWVPAALDFGLYIIVYYVMYRYDMLWYDYNLYNAV